MEITIISSLVSFFIAFVSIPVVIKISDAKKLFDQPGDRKIHFTPVPSLGGVGIFAALSFTICTFVSFNEYPEIQYFFSAAIIIFFLGLKDDILLISPIKKFTGQLMAAFLLSFQGHFQLDSLHGFMGVHDLHPALATVFTYLTMLVIINAFNLIDGVDGLAGMLGMVSTLFFGIVFTIEHQTAFAILAFSTAGALMAFLMYNFSPARVFMGDTGSLLLGLVNAVLVIKFINLETSGTETILQFKAAPAVGFAALFVPLMDTLRVTVIRSYYGRSPFDPDTNHIHHILLRRGLSHLQVTGVLSISAIAFLVVGLLLQPMGVTFIIFSLIVLAVLVISILSWASSVDLHTLDKDNTMGQKKSGSFTGFFSQSRTSDMEMDN
jgi:UDP-N-acetylmuramyl pentapeptide phosphotransferase/UDP-N-acetylglucosamine-1-phosphate transferase